MGGIELSARIIILLFIFLSTTLSGSNVVRVGYDKTKVEEFNIGYLLDKDNSLSIDIVQNSHSSIFDSLSTMKIGKGFFKVLSWYDNEWGYSNRVVDLAVKISK